MGHTIPSLFQHNILTNAEICFSADIETRDVAVNDHLEISLLNYFDSDLSKKAFRHENGCMDTVQSSKKVMIENEFQKRTLQIHSGPLTGLTVH